MKFLRRESRVESRAPISGARKFFCARLHAAFTLVEIMISIALLALLIGAVYSTWMLILRSAQVGQSAAAQAQRERIAVRTIEDSLMCVQSFQASMKYYTFVVQNGDAAELSFTARLPEVFPRNGKFGDFNVRRLTFALEPGADSQNNLVLRQNPILMDLDKDEQAYPLVLARNVKKFAIECWDPNKLDWADEWDNTNAIPTMVRVSLEMGGTTASGNTTAVLSFSRVVAIPSITLPTVAQTGGGVGLGGPGLPVLPGANNNPGGGQNTAVPVQPNPNNPGGVGGPQINNMPLPPTLNR
jgi:prepilin-type N-terminal cleavage/methylation domain-containing protein